MVMATSRKILSVDFYKIDYFVKESIFNVFYITVVGEEILQNK